MGKTVKRIVITGAKGLIGWHAHAHLHAANCAARFQGKPVPFDIVGLSHTEFQDDGLLNSALTGAETVLHFAGVNRAPDNQVETANPDIARQLIAACKATGTDPHIVYANSTHASGDTAYGRSKRYAAKILSDGANRFTNLVLPHIFGEGARPFYNNVTATLIHQIIAGEKAIINPDGRVRLLHAGQAVKAAIQAALTGKTGTLEPTAHPISVPDLYEKLEYFHSQYQANIYPDLSDPFDLSLFNSYRTATFPDGWPRKLNLNSDTRGTLFEAVKGGGGGQCFLSTTKPGITRGNHFHINKVERFVVVRGQAVIRIRKVLTNEIREFSVKGDTPEALDMPTLHTHSIENTGDGDLLTLFWTHDLFDPANPDTYADEVMI